MKKKSFSYHLTLLVLFSYHFAGADIAQAAADDFSILNSSLKMIWGLLVVLGILLIIYGLIKKKGTLFHGNSSGLIKVIETRHLMPKKSLFLVEVRGKEFLVGSGGDSLSLIASFDEKTSPNVRFEEILEGSQPVKPA